MRLEKLEYHKPGSLAEACRLMSSLDGVRLVGGGTDVLSDLKQGLIKAGNLVSLAGISDLKTIEEHDGSLLVETEEDREQF